MSDNESNEITLRATSWTVSASEKVSTGQYENYNPHITLEGEIPAEELTEAAREDVRERLLSIHGDLHAVLQKAASNRLAEPEWEDWTFGEDGPEVRSVEDVEEDAGAPTNEH